MPDEMTRADSLREYHTGAGSDGAAQADPALSLGNHRSSTQVASLGIAIANAISGITVDFAAGANGEGVGTLTAVSSTVLTWTPPGGAAGQQVTFSGTQTKIVEGLLAPGKFLRVTGTPPFTAGASAITLSDLYNNFHGFDNVTVAQAAAGMNQYRATSVKNVSVNDVLALQRWVASLGTARASDAAQLSGGGSGTIATAITTGYDDWPDSGWAQVRDSGGSLKEVVYYPSRTSTVLTVPAAGRGLLGTSATAGADTDIITPVPGIAIAIDPEGVTAAGEAIQTVAGQTTAPAGVTWNLGITAAGGLQIGSMDPGEQVGVWVWRRIPAGAVAVPKQLYKVNDRFTAY